MAATSVLMARVRELEEVALRRPLWEDEEVELRTIKWCMDSISAGEKQKAREKDEKIHPLFRKMAGVATAALLVMFSTVAQAEVVTQKICASKTLSASNASLYGLGNGLTDCTYTDVSGFQFFSFQAQCTDAGDSAVSVSFDWVAASGASSTYAVPILASGSAMAQLITSRTTETTLTTLQSIQPPVSPMATIRITNGETDTDVTCDVYLNMGR